MSSNIVEKFPSTTTSPPISYGPNRKSFKMVCIQISYPSIPKAEETGNPEGKHGRDRYLDSDLAITIDGNGTIGGRN